MRHQYRTAVLSLCTIVAAGAAGAQVRTDTTMMITATPTSLKWAPAPPSVPPGAQIVVLQGDPTQTGIYVMRLQFPKGYRVPPHYHAGDEHITVIQGTFQLGMGDTFNSANLTSLPVGSYGLMPAGMHHYAQAAEETIIQLEGMGPFTITYVNPADDPRTKSQTLVPSTKAQTSAPRKY